VTAERQFTGVRGGVIQKKTALVTLKERVAKKHLRVKGSRGGKRKGRAGGTRKDTANRHLALHCHKNKFSCGCRKRDVRADVKIAAMEIRGRQSKCRNATGSATKKAKRKMGNIESEVVRKQGNRGRMGGGRKRDPSSRGQPQETEKEIRQRKKWPSVETLTSETKTEKQTPIKLKCIGR